MFEYFKHFFYFFSPPKFLSSQIPQFNPTLPHFLRKMNQETATEGQRLKTDDRWRAKNMK